MPYRNPNSFFENVNDLVDGFKNRQGLQPQFNDLIAQVQAGTMNPNDLYAWATQNGYELTAEQEKFIDNAIAAWNTHQSQNWQEEMRDNSILSTAEQYEALGLSGSNVLQGQIASTPSTGIAGNSKTNLAEQRAQRKLAMTQTMIGLIKGLMSAGIGGGALLAAKKLGASSGLQTVAALGNSSKSNSSYPDYPNQKTNYDSVPNRDFEAWLKASNEYYY